MVKTCIWCLCTEENSSFNTKAHTIPKTLGGVAYCDNVCDNCNFYFGNAQNGYPSIETILKETFNLSRLMLLNGRKPINNNKWRYTSEYFNVHKNSLDLKPKYSIRAGFQSKVCRLMKRGLFKIFLEENERANGTSLDDKFQFIREYARRDLGDFPVLYFPRAVAVMLTGDKLIANPHMMFSEPLFNYLIRDYNFYEFEFFGHVLSLPISKNWELAFRPYIKKSVEEKQKVFNGNFFKPPIAVEHWNDIDLPLSVFKD